MSTPKSTLRCDRVSVQVAAHTLLSSTTLTLQAGRITAVLGPNGAGKSTLLSVLSGQQPPSTGQVRLDDQPLACLDARALAQRRAVMLQESAVAFGFEAQEVVALGRFPHRHNPCHDEPALIHDAMVCTDVQALRQRSFNTLSGGEKARVHLARVLAQLWQPHPQTWGRWLLLDEPTAALDLAHQHAAMRLLRERAAQGLGVVVVLHDLNLALRYAHEVVVVNAGHDTQHGNTHDMLQTPLVEHVWQTPCQAVTSQDGTRQLLFG